MLYNESKNNILAFVGKANKEICWVACPPDTLKKCIYWVIFRVLKTQCNAMKRGLLQQFTLQRSSTGFNSNRIK